ncbi:hypothetical protein T02_3281 [Trichinella nativa]|uniref:Uncharacterized protein n=1 Tax=Trichinella nativa TaxID=6335 RepID=A0A0V1KS59_9BILA|nr:hypothetical protein T02_3281 [Trichinella nativa]
MVVGCPHGPVGKSAVVLFDLLIVRLLVIGNVVVILLNLMIWHSNCWDKRSRTVVVPHVNGLAQSIVTELSMRSVLENIAVRLDGIRETVCRQYYYSYLHPCAAEWKEVRNLLLLTMKLHQLLAFSLSGTVLVDALVEPVSLKIEADPRQPK